MQSSRGDFKGIGLFICTHMSRDARCGRLGYQLARRLQEIVDERGYDKVHIYQASHVGGHKVQPTSHAIQKLLPGLTLGMDFFLFFFGLFIRMGSVDFRKEDLICKAQGHIFCTMHFAASFNIKGF